jgi:hypothetical protein
MTGIAMFTDETMNGVRNEAMTAMRRAVRFVEASCMASAELSDEREENAEEQAYDNACGQGKREGEVFALDDDIARKPAEERDLREEQQEEPYRDEHGPEQDEAFCQVMHL